MKPTTKRRLWPSRFRGLEILEDRYLLSGVVAVQPIDGLDPLGSLVYASKDNAGALTGSTDQADVQLFAEAAKTAAVPVLENTTAATTAADTNEAPVLTSPSPIEWWTDPALQNREAFAGNLSPHYWCKDESDQFLFVTTSSGAATGSAYLYSIPSLVAAHADNAPTPVASVATATELGVSFLRGGAVSDDLGRALTGTASASPVYASLPTDGTQWTSSTVAKITNDQNVVHDSMAFSHDSTQLFSNNYAANRNRVYTWNVGDLTTDGVGLTQATTFDSSVARIRSLSSYYIDGKDLVYFGDGTGGDEVVVYDPATGTETVLVTGLTGGDIMYAKVSGVGTGQMYLYVGAEVAGSPTIATISVYALAADGKSVTSTTPVASFAGAALMTDILGVAPNYNRAFEVTNDGQFGFFGTHAAGNVYTVSADVPAGNTTPEGVACTFDADATDVGAPPQTLTFSLVDAPSGAAIDPASGVFTWTPSEEQGPGDFTFRVRVSDGTATDDEWVTLRVTEVNVAPVLTGVPATASIAELAAYTFDANATDVDVPAQTLTFSLLSAPTGAAIDPASGVFTWTPTEEQGPGDYPFTVRVSDGTTNTDQSVTLTVTAGSLDVDGNGSPDALTDGILILRYLFDSAGAWSYSDALGSNATRTTRTAIKTFLDDARTTMLDVDGNGTPDALTDGILILRYLFDSAGAWSYSDALGSNATRTTRTAIKAHLDQFNPGLISASANGAADLSVAPAVDTGTSSDDSSDASLAIASTDDTVVVAAASIASESLLCLPAESVPSQVDDTPSPAKSVCRATAFNVQEQPIANALGDREASDALFGDVTACCIQAVQAPDAALQRCRSTSAEEPLLAGSNAWLSRGAAYGEDEQGVDDLFGQQEDDWFWGET